MATKTDPDTNPDAESESPNEERPSRKTEPVRDPPRQGGQITWLDPAKPKFQLFSRTFLLYAGLSMLVVGSCAYGIYYYVEKVFHLRTEIKDTLSHKGYFLYDPVILARFNQMDKTILLSKLRELLAQAQALPFKDVYGMLEFTPDNSYLAYIKENKLPFDANEAIKWLVQHYR